ncbi:MAG: DUF3990 domain-containing protein [Endomicrobium sp.]|jgi:hypothetical protein|nr:DUF3990 domain-containing protein [Endomicrobium sp.]
MKLFHGSTVSIENPKIIIAEYGRDFGSGFYTTDIKEQAVRWAKRKAAIEINQGRNSKAIISIYDFDEANYDKLNVKVFSEPSLDWLNMVCACRSGIGYKHGYDIVEGKIANDNVGETVSFVVAGIMRKEDALERLKFEKINNQICFNTDKALSFLNYAGFEEA